MNTHTTTRTATNDAQQTTEAVATLAAALARLGQLK